MDEILTLSPSLGSTFYIALAVVYSVNIFKWLFYKLPWKWVEKTPGKAWVVLAFFIALGVCVYGKIDAVGAILGGEAPVSGFPAYIVTALLISISSNVLYKVSKPIAKKAEDTILNEPVLPPTPPEHWTVNENLPINEEEQATPVVFPEPTVETPKNTEKNMLLSKVKLKDTMYTYVDGKLYTIEGESDE